VGQGRPLIPVILPPRQVTHLALVIIMEFGKLPSASRQQLLQIPQAQPPPKCQRKSNSSRVILVLGGLLFCECGKYAGNAHSQNANSGTSAPNEAQQPRATPSLKRNQPLASP
jgi:hypothetical protein